MVSGEVAEWFAECNGARTYSAGLNWQPRFEHVSEVQINYYSPPNVEWRRQQGAETTRKCIPSKIMVQSRNAGRKSHGRRIEGESTNIWWKTLFGGGKRMMCLWICVHFCGQRDATVALCIHYSIVFVDIDQWYYNKKQAAWKCYDTFTRLVIASFCT